MRLGLWDEWEQSLQEGILGSGFFFTETTPEVLHVASSALINKGQGSEGLWCSIMGWLGQNLFVNTHLLSSFS